MPRSATADAARADRRRLVALLASSVVLACLGVTQPAGATTCANRLLPAQPAFDALVETAVLCETNNRRVEAGLPALARNAQLDAAARAHASDMVERGYFDHDSPEGLGPSERGAQQGYAGVTCCGENIYDGPDDAMEAVQGWMDSPGHRANILEPGYLEIGVGVVGTMYVQLFASDLLAPGITGLELEHQGAANARPPSPGVRMASRAPRRVAIRGGSAVGQRAELTVERRVKRCRRFGCFFAWRSVRHLGVTLGERSVVTLGAPRPGLRGRVTLVVPAFASGGEPYLDTRITRTVR